MCESLAGDFWNIHKTYNSSCIWLSECSHSLNPYQHPSGLVLSTKMLHTRLATSIVISLAIILSAYARPPIHLDPRQAPLRPEHDAWYEPPSGFENQPPGTVLKHRMITPAFFGVIPDPIEVHQLLYSTKAVNGSAIATATTIFTPPVPFRKTDRYLTYLTAYDAAAPYCRPSYTYQAGADQWSAIVVVERLVMELFLLQGYIVNVPDYEGPDDAFAIGRLQGMTSLDSMRAVNEFRETLGLEDNAPVVGTGYSGGGLAAGWSAAFHPWYAPELNVRGWAAGGIPANLTGIVDNINGGFFASFVPLAIAGMTTPSTWGKELSGFFDRILTQKGKDAISFVKHNCIVQNLFQFFGENVFDREWQNSGPDVLYEPTLANVLSKTVLGVDEIDTPSVPVYVYHARKDNLIPYDGAEKTVGWWCERGANVHFTTFEAGGHASTLLVGVPAMMDFVERAFNGTAQKGGCTRDSQITDPASLLALGLNIEPDVFGLLDQLLRADDDPSVIV